MFSIFIYKLVICQRWVSISSWCKSMRRTLNCSPVLTCCQTDTIDPVHNSFIMSSSSVLVYFSETESLNDFFGNFQSINSFPFHIFNGNLKKAWSSSLHAIITKNCYPRFDTHFWNIFFCLLTKRVRNVSTHGFTNIYKYIHWIMFWKWPIQLSNSQVYNASPSFSHTLTWFV